MKTIGLVTVLALALASPARADQRNWGWSSSSGRPWRSSTSAFADTLIKQQTNRAILNLGKKPTGQTSAPAAHRPISDTDFASGRQRLAVAPIIESFATSPEQRATLASAVDAMFAAYERGMRKHNVAHAMAFMVGAAYGTQSGTMFEDDQLLELAAGLNDMLAQSSELARAKAVDRQRMYETFVTLGSLVLIFRELGQSDPASAQMAQALAGQVLASVGVASPASR